MPDKDLQDLVRRRLWELARAAAEAPGCPGGRSPGDHRADGAAGSKSFISEGLAEFLARALVPENRVRRAAGLPPVPDGRESISTGPHLRLLRNDE